MEKVLGCYLVPGCHDRYARREEKIHISTIGSPQE